MSEFNSRARDWDKNRMHHDRAAAIADAILNTIPIEASMTALEFGAGTGLLSFCLKDHFAYITLMDSSSEMVRVTQEKIVEEGVQHMNALCLDLELSEYNHRFDMVYNQMVMHHVVDVKAMLAKFYALINPNGYLAIADLYPEDGSFHGKEVNVHKGFDPADLAKVLDAVGFRNVEHKQCFVVERETGETFPVFLLVAQK